MLTIWMRYDVAELIEMRCFVTDEMYRSEHPHSIQIQGQSIQSHHKWYVHNVLCNLVQLGSMPSGIYFPSTESTSIKAEKNNWLWQFVVSIKSLFLYLRLVFISQLIELILLKLCDGRRIFFQSFVRNEKKNYAHKLRNKQTNERTVILVKLRLNKRFSVQRLNVSFSFHVKFVLFIDFLRLAQFDICSIGRKLTLKMH